MIYYIYYKSTDKHAYLRYDPGHPHKCKDCIPFSQFLRMRRICSKTVTFDSESSKMVEFFFEKGYPFSVATDGLRKGRGIQHDFALRTHSNGEHHKISWWFHILLQARLSILFPEIFVFLVNDNEIGNLFGNIITAYKIANRKHIVHASLHADEIPGIFPCGRKLDSGNMLMMSFITGLKRVMCLFISTIVVMVMHLTCASRMLRLDWIGLNLFNNDRCPTRHISHLHN